MKVYLDDVRTTPEGWVRAYWPEEVITLLKTGQILELSLDHDLGDDARGTGYTVLQWLEKEVFHDRTFPVPDMRVHSANPVGAARMRELINRIKELKDG